MPAIIIIVVVPPAMVAVAPAPVVAVAMVVVVAAAVIAAVVHRPVGRIGVVIHGSRIVVVRRRGIIARVVGVIRRRIVRAAVVAVDAVVVADAVTRAVEAQADAHVAAREGGGSRHGAGQQQARCEETATKDSGFHDRLRSVDASGASSGRGDESVLSAGPPIRTANLFSCAVSEASSHGCPAAARNRAGYWRG